MVVFGTGGNNPPPPPRPLKITLQSIKIDTKAYGRAEADLEIEEGGRSRGKGNEKGIEVNLSTHIGPGEYDASAKTKLPGGVIDAEKPRFRMLKNTNPGPGEYEVSHLCVYPMRCDTHYLIYISLLYPSLPFPPSFLLPFFLLLPLPPSIPPPFSLPPLPSPLPFPFSLPLPPSLPSLPPASPSAIQVSERYSAERNVQC